MNTSLAGEITVFVISVDGNPNHQDCLNALKEQDCKFRIAEIKNVYPMSEAFQRMINWCSTPFFVQVDNDMVLYKYAISTLYKAITDFEGYNFVDYPLWDSHLDMPISGVKIYRTEIFKNARFSNNTFSCEKEIYERLEKAYGKFRYEKIREENCLGQHSPKWTPYLIYQRYRNLIEKAQIYSWIRWPNELPKKFLKRFQENPTELNFFALAGVMHGIISDKSKLNSERDFRTYSVEEVKKLKEMFYG